MNDTDTPTNKDWLAALQGDGVARYSSTGAATRNCKLDAFTVELLSYNWRREGKAIKDYRARLIRDDTDSIIYDTCGFRSRSVTFALLHAAIDAQFEIETSHIS